MERLATLVLRDTDFQAQGDLFGCEKGALAILDQGLVLKGAFGDFDSVTETEFKRIEAMAQSLIKVPSQKDETDSDLAISHLIAAGYDRIFIHGALGERVDHQHINLVLMATHPQVVLMAPTQRIQAYGVGSHRLVKDDYEVFSVFTFTQAVIDLEHCRYPLKEHAIDALNRLTISNAWIDDEALLKVHRGEIFVVYSKA